MWFYDKETENIVFIVYLVLFCFLFMLDIFAKFNRKLKNFSVITDMIVFLYSSGWYFAIIIGRADYLYRFNDKLRV